MSASRLCFQTATAVVDRLRAGEVSPLDCLDALERRIAETNPATNAIVTVAFERARHQARVLMDRPMAERGLLAGLPVAIKDLLQVKGIRSTEGSPIFADRIPTASDILVETVEREGGVIYAMTNTPEFGAGAHTFNEVFGLTRNPWNVSRSAAGSSGGSAVALATGTAWLANGSDLGGSLRNPASFNSIVGLRPTPGRVARSPGRPIDDRLSVEGPMGRTVEDVALFLDALSGEDPGDPISLPRGASFLAAARSGARPRRVAYSRDLKLTPVDPVVAWITQDAARRFAEIGVSVEETDLDLSDAPACFQTLRAYGYAQGMKPYLDAHRDKLKPEVIWNIEKGLALTVEQLIAAETARVAIIRRLRTFFETYDLLLAPATIVPPFPADQRYVTSCDGVTFETYIDWLAIAFPATLAGLPALSLPAGFTSDGLPVGLQMIAPARQEGRLLAFARALEEILGLRDLTPIDPRGALV